LQIAVLGVVVVGQTLVLLTRSIDMSVGAVMGLGAVIVVQTTGQSILLSVIIAIVIAAAIGLGNGLLITKRNVPPFVATFGMMIFVEGARLAVTKGQVSGTVPVFLRKISIEPVWIIPAGIIVLLIVNLIINTLLTRTRFGRWIYAVGGNPSATYYSGINIDMVTIVAHVLCSLFALLGGLLLSGYIGYVDLGLGANYNMSAVAAAIIGGTMLIGGRGNLLGSFAGVTLYVILLNLVVVMGLAIHWQYVVQGLMLVLATGLQGYRQHRLNK